MDRSVVRESKFRHVYGKCWRKEICLTNVKLLSSANQRNAICSSDKYIAIPWQTAGGSGALAVIPHSQPGPKLPSNYEGVASTGPSPVTDMHFSPFHSELLVSSSRESSVAVWAVDEADGKVTVTRSSSLEGHSGRIASMSFHPSLDNILATSSSDKTIRLWDVAGERQVYAVDDATIEEVAQDMVWNIDGSLLAASYQKQKVVRVYDVRQNRAVHDIAAHEGSKGTFLCFLENDRLLSVGSSKTSRREICLWDLQSGDVGEPIAKQVMSGAGGNSSSPLIPFYDPGTGLVYLTGRGDLIFYYEINNEGECIHPLNSCKTSAYIGACPVPKRVCDVKQTEIQRFYLAGKDNIRVVSMSCPRKKAATIFQEDLFPPEPTGEPPTVTFDEWLAGKESDVPYASLQPEGTRSVFDLSSDSGGKDRKAELRKTLSRSASRHMLKTNSVALLAKPKVMKETVSMFTGGWWSKWADRFLQLEDDVLYCYESENSPALILSVPAKDVEDVSVSEEHSVTDGTLFCVHHLDDSTDEKYYFRAASAESCNGWVATIRSAGIQPVSSVAGRSSSNLLELFRASRKASVSEGDGGEKKREKKKESDVDQDGAMMMWTAGYLYNGWVRRWFVLQKDVLLVYKSSSTRMQHPLEKFHMAKVIAVGRSEESTKEHALKLCTADRVVHLAAGDEEEQETWLSVLQHAAGLQDAPTIAVESADGEEEEECQLVEGMVQKKNGGMMGFAKRWTTYFLSGGGKELLYFKNKMGMQPDFRISVPLIMDVRASEQYPEDGFEVVTVDREVHVHRAEDKDDQQRWIRSLRFLRNQFVNHFEALGITEDDLSKKLKAAAMKNFIDPVEVKNGRCPLLIMVKGRRKITVELVPLSPSSLTEKSAFVLDHGTTMYQWNGARAPRVAKAKAADVLSKIRQKERGGTVQVVVLNQGKNDGTNPKFCALLGGKPPKPTSASVSDADSLLPTKHEKQEEGSFSIRIYRMLDEDVPAEARLKLIHEGTRQPPRELLTTKSTHVIDCGSELYVWVGKESNAYQRQLALVVAQKLQDQEERDEATSITRVYEEGETILFKEKFSNFPGMLPIQVQRQETKSNIAVTREQADIDVQALADGKAPAHPLVEEGKGKIVKMWKIEDFEKEELAEEYYGQLWSGDSFIVLYRYPYNNKEKNLVYFWQGRNSSRNERGTSAYITVDISDEVGDAEQVRVEQGKEEEHFKLITKDRLIVHQGKFTARQEHQKASRLFKFVADQPADAHPVEVPLAATSLHPLFSFVLVQADDTAFVWQGSLSSDAEKGAAAAFARRSASSSVSVFAEKEETESFWTAIGGGTDYPCKGVKGTRALPRLFLASNATGSVEVEEIFQFTQEDTRNNTHALVLVLFNEVYVWFSEKAANAEKKIAMEVGLDMTTVLDYLDEETQVWVTHPGEEPAEFTSQFVTWEDDKKAKKEKKRTPVMEVLTFYLPKTYPYSDLMKDPLPPGVDPTRLESYLSPDEFLSIFGMDRETFMKQPQWKAEQLKQKAKLF